MFEILKKKVLAILRPFSHPYKASKSEFSVVAEKYSVSPAKVYFHYLYCCMRYGCMAFQYTIFDFYGKRHDARKAFVCETENYECYAKKFNSYLRANGTEHNNVFVNKVEFNKRFQPFVNREWIYISPNSSSSLGGGNEFVTFIKKHRKVIAKPLKGNGGHGIRMVTYSDDDSALSIYDQLICAGEYIVEELLQQCDELNAINSSSVNTVRVVAFRNKEILTLIGVSLRIGRNGSFVDNFSSGGVMYPVDVETGFVVGPGLDRDGHTYFVHPGTDCLMLGYQLPKYEEIKEFIAKAMEIEPDQHWVGWDVCIAEDKLYMVEGNLGPGCETYQIDGIGKRELIESLCNCC